MNHDHKVIRQHIHTVALDMNVSIPLDHEFLHALCISYTQHIAEKLLLSIQEDIVHKLALYGTDQLNFGYTDQGFAWQHQHAQQLITEGSDIRSLIAYIQSTDVAV